MKYLDELLPLARACHADKSPTNQLLYIAALPPWLAILMITALREAVDVIKYYELNSALRFEQNKAAPWLAKYNPED